MIRAAANAESLTSLPGCSEMKATPIVILAASVALCACASTSTLAPLPTAQVGETAEQLQARQQQHRDEHGPQLTIASNAPQVMIMRDGTLVRKAIDLLPHVDAASHTAKAAAQAESAAWRAQAWSIGGAAMTGVGITTMLLPLIVRNVQADTQLPLSTLTRIVVAGGVVAFGGLGLTLFGADDTLEMNTATAAAFAFYPEDLKHAMDKSRTALPTTPPPTLTAPPVDQVKQPSE
jgi:hypothetical protein